jgi:hypothetical protein
MGMKISLKNILLIGAAIFAAYNIGMVGAFIEGKPAGSVKILAQHCATL